MKLKDKIGKEPLMWTEEHGGHLFIYWRGKPIYKNYPTKEPSVLFNEYWPNVRVE